MILEINIKYLAKYLYLIISVKNSCVFCEILPELLCILG